MISLRFQELANDIGGKLLNHELADRPFRGVSIDSRSIQPEQLFVAIRGRNTDGHGYIDQAISEGAAGLLIENSFADSGQLPQNVAAVAVPDSHLALLKLASTYLDRVNPRRVGITGSNGKTTTKEYAYQLIAAAEEAVYRSPGNLNNLYGLPLSLLGMPQKTKIALFELGISEPGEMKQLAGLLRPEVAVVTNVGATHLEFLGTVEGVAEEKLSIIDPVLESATLIVNADDELLLKKAKARTDRVVTFGLTHSADITPDKIEQKDDHVAITIDGATFRLNVFGEYQFQNLLAAFAVAKTLGIKIDADKARTIQLATTSMRGEKITVGSVTFISDCYNANPESVKAGLLSFQHFSSDGRKIVVLGDMLELGAEDVRYHREAFEQAVASGFDLTLFVGKSFCAVAEQSNSDDSLAMTFHDAKTAADALLAKLQPNDLVYLKGSRGIGLELIIEQVRQREEQG